MFCLRRNLDSKRISFYKVCKQPLTSFPPCFESGLHPFGNTHLIWYSSLKWESRYWTLMFPHLTKASLKSLPWGWGQIRDPLLVIRTQLASTHRICQICTTCGAGVNFQHGVKNKKVYRKKSLHIYQWLREQFHLQVILLSSLKYTSGFTIRGSDNMQVQF